MDLTGFNANEVEPNHRGPLPEGKYLAIIISFQFRSPPTHVEKRMSLPLGLVFWVLSLASLANGFANYVRTVRKYSRRAALVQSGWKTQAMFGIVGGVILGSCVVFLVTDANKN